MENSRTPLISVVIAVRDRSHYLREALISLQLQTIIEWECIIVDDYSVENIQTVVKEMNDPRFVYLRNTGVAGISASRNLGNLAARATWIAVADSDDLNLPRRLSVTLNAIKMNPEYGVVYSRMCTFPDGSYTFSDYSPVCEYNRRHLYEYNFIPHSASAYRRDLVLETGYTSDYDSAVDYDLWLTLSGQKVKFLYIDEALVLYRIHPEQISSNPAKRARQAENALKIKNRHLSM